MTEDKAKTLTIFQKKIFFLCPSLSFLFLKDNPHYPGKRLICQAVYPEQSHFWDSRFIQAACLEQNQQSSVGVFKSKFTFRYKYHEMINALSASRPQVYKFCQCQYFEYFNKSKLAKITILNDVKPCKYLWSPIKDGYFRN